MSSTSITLLRDRLVGLAIDQDRLLEFAKRQDFRYQDLAMGHRLGVMAAPKAIEILLRRMEDGEPLTSEEEYLALLLRDQIGEAEDLLMNFSVDDTDLAGASGRKWLTILEKIVLDDWSKPGFDGKIWLSEILSCWPILGEFDGRLLSAKGVDRIYFGQAAHNRLRRRLIEVIERSARGFSAS